MSNRRDFIKQSALAGSALLLAGAGAEAASKPAGTVSGKALKVLILGGTGYIGPHFVRAALDRGHRVAVFNRGKSNAGLPPNVEQLIGDREGDLKSIENRDWDAVFDLPTLIPKWVRTLGQALKGRVGHYTYISSIIAYQYPGATDEQSKLQVYQGTQDPYLATSPGSTIPAIGAMKVLCEQEAQRQFPGKVAVLRPGTIVGAGDGVGAFTYWVARMERGGEILAGGEPLSQVQFIDVRDLAEWAVRLAESGETGAFTAVGPTRPLSWAEMLGGIRAAYANSATLTWIPSEWLTQRGIAPFSALLFWPAQVGIPGATELDNRKACAHGLTFRPLHTTVMDTLEWYKSLPPERQRTALIAFDQKSKALDDAMARERELLSQWHEHSPQNG